MIYLFHTATIFIILGGAIADILVGHKSEITAIGITSEGMRAISASLDNTIKMWDLRTGKVTKTINGVGKNVLQVSFSIYSVSWV